MRCRFANGLSFILTECQHMPIIYQERPRPPEWKDFRPMPLHPYLLPFSYTNWAGEWMAYILGKWSIFEVLDYVGSLSILVAVIFYFAGAGDRLKQAHFQAWQVINTAQGKGGNGGRIDAMQELNDDGVSLVGVDVSGSYLRGVSLIHADLRRGSFDGADLRDAVLRDSVLASASLRGANLRKSDCSHVDFTEADFSDADLNGAVLSDAQMQNATFDRADLRGSDLSGLRDWQSIASMTMANIGGVRDAPDGFLAWAASHGAVDVGDDAVWNKMISHAAATQPLGIVPGTAR
jgi:hypothetical protein